MACLREGRRQSYRRGESMEPEEDLSPHQLLQLRIRQRVLGSLPGKGQHRGASSHSGLMSLSAFGPQSAT
jgi:hypothetical protein